jgi:hypothetical protein
LAVRDRHVAGDVTSLDVRKVALYGGCTPRVCATFAAPNHERFNSEAISSDCRGGRAY